MKKIILRLAFNTFVLLIVLFGLYQIYFVANNDGTTHIEERGCQEITPKINSVNINYNDYLYDFFCSNASWINDVISDKESIAAINSLNSLSEYLSLCDSISSVQSENLDFFERKIELSKNDSDVIELPSASLNFGFCKWYDYNSDVNTSFSKELGLAILRYIKDKMKSSHYQSYVDLVNYNNRKEVQVQVSYPILKSDLALLVHIKSRLESDPVYEVDSFYSVQPIINDEKLKIYDKNSEFSFFQFPLGHQSPIEPYIIDRSDFEEVAAISELQKSIEEVEANLHSLAEKFKSSFIEDLTGVFKISSILNEKNIVCKRDGKKVELVFVTSDTEIIESGFDGPRKMKDLISGDFAGFPHTDLNGNRFIYIYVRKKFLKKRSYIVPFLVFHELAHHNVHNIYNEKHYDINDEKLNALDELDADCEAVSLFAEINSFKSGYYFLLVQDLFEKRSGSGGGSHPAFYQRYEKMTECVREYLDDDFVSPFNY